MSKSGKDNCEGCPYIEQNCYFAGDNIEDCEFKQKRDKEWHPTYPDWNKVHICTPCRMPSTDNVKSGILRYTPVRCRDCMFADIEECEECGEEIRHCTFYTVQHGPPSTEIDKPRKCVLHVPKTKKK